MLDLKFIRENADLVRKAIASRKDTGPLDEILQIDSDRRRKVAELEELRRARKSVAKEGVRSEASSNQGRDLRGTIRTLEDEVRTLETHLQDLLLQMPNIPDPSVPVGSDSSDNVTVRTYGEPRKFDFTPKPHWELAEKLGIIDFERGVKLSGTRFYILSGLGARLQRAVIAYMLQLHTDEHGYREIYPPYMVKRDIMTNSGNLPKFADNLYHDEQDDLWFVPTAEVPLTSLHSGEILPPDSLPIHYVSYTACFRREQMSAGKDTRGIKRGHQFDKVELYKLTDTESGLAELETLVHDAEEIGQKLGLPYRVIQLCTADMGFSSKKTYDIEMWSPGVEEWLEVSSCSWCGDFQARRANIRFRPAADKGPQYVHTLNGSGMALPRVMISIMENYQQADGSIRIPEVLQAFMGTDVIK